MATTAHDVFAKAVRALPPNERLQLATLILQDLAQSGVVVIDQSDVWSEQDQTDLTAFSLRYAAQRYLEHEDVG